MRELSHDSAQDELIRELSGTLTPVRPLAPPIWRALGWTAAVVVLGLAGAMFADLPALRQRLMSAPDMWLAVIGSSLTAFLAVLAAFELALPDRSPRWALLPLPAALLWIGASGVGCLRAIPIVSVREPGVSDGRDCLLIILGLSIPLSVLLLAMLRRGYSLRPGLTAAIAGLAVSAAAATLLMFYHPFDATLSDLTVHAIGIAIVIAAIRWLGISRIAPQNFSSVT